MKTVSSILVTVAIIATSEATFGTMGEAGLNRLRQNYVEMENVRSRARAMNSHAVIRFYLTNQGNENLITFKARDLLLNPPHEDPCGNDLGVYVEGARQFFCRITYLRITITRSERGVPRFFWLYLYFQKPGFPSLELATFIVKTPETVIPTNPAELDTWIRHYGAGIFSPFDYERLSRAESTKTLTMSFGWLRNLLKLGVVTTLEPGARPVSRAEPGEMIKLYTRPLFLPENFMTRIKEVVEALGTPLAESEGSNSPENSESLFLPEE